MCTVSVEINEDAIRDVLPELNNTAAIRSWIQMLIDARIGELIAKDDETMSIDDALEMTLSAVREEYARP